MPPVDGGVDKEIKRNTILEIDLYSTYCIVKKVVRSRVFVKQKNGNIMYARQCI
jgi:hypothetical protein